MVPESLSRGYKIRTCEFPDTEQGKGYLRDIDFTHKRGEKNCPLLEKAVQEKQHYQNYSHLYQAESGNILSINDNNTEDIQIEMLREKSHISHRKHFLVVQYLKILHWDWMKQRWMTSLRHQKKERRYMNLLINCHSDMRDKTGGKRSKPVRRSKAKAGYSKSPMPKETGYIDTG